jgi:hypothetical protein
MSMGPGVTGPKALPGSLQKMGNGGMLKGARMAGIGTAGLREEPLNAAVGESALRRGEKDRCGNARRIVILER